MLELKRVDFLRLRWVDYLRLVNGYSEKVKSEWVRYYQLLYAITGHDGYREQVDRLNDEPIEKITKEEYYKILNDHKAWQEKNGSSGIKNTDTK